MGRWQGLQLLGFHDVRQLNAGRRSSDNEGNQEVFGVEELPAEHVAAVDCLAAGQVCPAGPLQQHASQEGMC